MRPRATESGRQSMMKRPDRKSGRNNRSCNLQQLAGRGWGGGGGQGEGEGAVLKVREESKET